MPRAYEEKGAYGSQNEEKGPTKTKNEGIGAYKGQNEGNRPSIFFALQKFNKRLGPTRASIRACIHLFIYLFLSTHSKVTKQWQYDNVTTKIKVFDKDEYESYVVEFDPESPLNWLLLIID